MDEEETLCHSGIVYRLCDYQTWEVGAAMPKELGTEVAVDEVTPHDEKDAERYMANLIQCNHPFVLFSGGKDSLAALSYVAEIAQELKREVTAVYADTTVGLPCNGEYVREMCELLDVELTVVRPETDYFTLAERYGLPHIRARWCCRALKVGPIADYLGQHNGAKVVFDGIRAQESRQRSKRKFIEGHKVFQCTVCHPIIHWSREEVEGYLASMSLPINPAYGEGFARASECWCGVFKQPQEFESLCRHYPDFFDKLVELEAKQRSGFAYIWRNGKRTYLRDIREKVNGGPGV